MDWEGVTAVDQRVRFIGEYLTGRSRTADICRQFGISRKTGYKWIKRYEAEGPEGLETRSSRPRQCPHQTDEDIVQALIRARKRYTWGPKKLLVIIAPRFPGRRLPGISTAARILKQQDLIKPKRRRMRKSHPGCPKHQAKAPNEIWTADYKGQFKLRNGKYCYPLTVCDMHSRYLLGCDAQPAISLAAAKDYFTRVFEEYGLPERIRTDNGVPFASNAPARLSTLSVWWLKLGIYPELIEPGKPQQNGKHERMHRDMKREATVPPERTFRAQQRRFDAFRDDFNEVRPHEALGMKTPSACYSASPRPMPRKARIWEYPANYIVRRVSKNNGIRWQHRWVNISHTLAEEYIGFEPIDEQRYNVYFRDLLIGRFSEQDFKLADVIRRVPVRPRNAEKCYQPTEKGV